MGRLAKQRATLGTAPTVALLVIAVALVGLLAAGIVAAFDPFGTETVDRSGPALLERIRTLEEFTAAEANFTQDVDIEQDAGFLPDFLKGERVTAIITGSVRASVDFSQLDEDAVEISDDRTTIRLTLPEPELSKADLNAADARIVARQRGLIDRFEDVFSGNPFDDTELYAAAEDKLEAAAERSDLVDQAKTNTERWLRTFLGAAGFDDVEISWVRPAS